MVNQPQQGEKGVFHFFIVIFVIVRASLLSEEDRTHTPIRGRGGITDTLNTKRSES